MSVLWVISPIARTPVAPDFPGHHEGALYYSLVSMFRSSPERLPGTETSFRSITPGAGVR
jgi:hypothetical protein